MLSHDLVEIYAGDTFIFDKEKASSQRQREKVALTKIKKRFSHFGKLITTIQNYEKKKDDESKFIYALDKMIPPLQIHLEGGKLWKEKKVSLEDLLEKKNKKIALSPDVEKYWKELTEEFTENKKKYFIR